MIRILFSLLITGLLFVSCTTTGEIQEESTQPEEQQEVADSSPKPDWYNHSERSTADSTTFKGMGMAASPDSAQAHRQAEEQAAAYLKYSIDSYAEKVRRNLAEGTNGDSFNNENFMIQLRNAVKNLEISNDDLQLEEEQFKTDDNIYRIYTKATINRRVAIERLSSLLSNETFKQSLADPEAL